MRKIDRRRLKFILGLIFTSICLSGSAQKYTHASEYDSIVISHLRNVYPKRTIGWTTITISNKKQRVKNYDSYLAFRLPIKGDIYSDTIEIVNFEITSEHEPAFMLVLYKSETGTDHFVLGGAELSKEIDTLQDFFNSLKKKIKYKYQLEIWDLFIKRRQGIAKTPIYLH